MNKYINYVIGIVSLSGGGKTALTNKLIEKIEDSTPVYFDEYDDFTTHPPMETWSNEDINYNDWKFPRLIFDLQSLKAGIDIAHPLTKTTVKANKFIIFDAAFGRANDELNQLIDLMVYIDTPLDVAMGRRILRGIENKEFDTLNSIKEDVEIYINRARQAYLIGDKAMRPRSDLVLDGTLTLEQLGKQVIQKLESKI